MVHIGQNASQMLFYRSKNATTRVLNTSQLSPGRATLPSEAKCKINNLSRINAGEGFDASRTTL